MSNELQTPNSELRTNDNRYLALFLASRDAVMTIEPPSWNFTSGNPATLKMFGAKDEAVFLSYPPWKLSPERQPDGRDSMEKAKEMIDDAMREGVNVFEWTHKRINGEEFPAEVLLSRVEYGGKFFLYAVVRDITERKNHESQLKRSAEEWEKTFNSISDLIFIQDVNHTILRANKAFADALKTTPEEIIGKKCYELLHKMNEPWPDCPFEKTRKDKIAHTEEIDDKNIGIPLLVTTSPTFDAAGNLTGSVHIAKNLAEFRRHKEELDEKLHDLEIFQKVAVDREFRQIELKKEINCLLEILGKKAYYEFEVDDETRTRVRSWE